MKDNPTKKFWFGAIFLLLLQISAAQAATVTVQWDAPQENGAPVPDLSYYLLFWRESAEAYSANSPIQVPGNMTSWDVSVTSGRTYYFKAQACDTFDNCSVDSNEASKSIPSSSVDGDGDGFISDNDCNDSRNDVYPDAPEKNDHVDNDCDGNIDESNHAPHNLVFAWASDGLTVDFSCSADDQESADILSYRIAFGDGASIDLGQSSSTSHIYSDAGAYRATCTVNDGFGGVSIVSVDLQATASTVQNGSSDTGNSPALASQSTTMASSGCGSASALHPLLFLLLLSTIGLRRLSRKTNR